MKVYIYTEEFQDYSKNLGILSEAAMFREKARLIEEAKKKRAEEISKKELEIELIKQERRELCLKDQKVNVPIRQALRASKDRAALKAFEKERKSILREIDDKFNQIWHLEFEIHLLNKLDGDTLITHYFPRLCFEQHDVIE
jgi:hypothetical protein